MASGKMIRLYPTKKQSEELVSDESLFIYIKGPWYLMYVGQWGLGKKIGHI